MSNYLAAVLVFIAVIATVASLGPILLKAMESTESQIQVRVEREFGGGKSIETPLLLLMKLKHGDGIQSRGSRRSIGFRFAAMVEHSRLGLRATDMLKIIVGCGVVSAVAVGWIWRIELGLIAGVVGAVTPFMYVRARARKRNEMLLTQLPEILDLIARFLRAGHSLPQALAAVPSEFRDPARELFTRFTSRMNLGLSLESGLRELVERAGLPEYRIAITAILTHYRSGGNLTNVCGRLGGVIRERFRVQGMIRTLTAEGLLQARILMVLPLAVFLVMLVVKRAYAISMLENPRLLAAVIGSQIIGILWIRRILKVNF
ncbi:MAG: type II secretion system F family protein [Planctomycetes bacterium]|nr:type II secretion system F family protein [Planctomycetota bacterium]